MTSFEQARSIAHKSIAPKWRRQYRGEYMVADYGFENATTWLLIDGARESIVDEDSGYEPIGRGSTLVDKASGKLFFRNYIEHPEWFQAMTPVGEHPEGRAD